MDAHLYAVGSDGDLKWRFKAGAGIETTPEDGTILVGSIDGSLYAINQVGAME